MLVVWTPLRRHEPPHPGHLQDRRPAASARRSRSRTRASTPVAPQVDFDNSGKAIVVWQRFDGANLRVQASIRNAGAGRHLPERGDPVRAGPGRVRPAAAPPVPTWTRTASSSGPLRRHEAAGPVVPPPGRGRIRAAEGRQPARGPRWCRRTTRAPSDGEPRPRAAAGVPVLQPAGAVFRRVDRRLARRQRLRSELRVVGEVQGDHRKRGNGGQRGRRPGDHQGRRRAQPPEPARTTPAGSAISVNLQITDHRNAPRAAGARHRPGLPARVVGPVRGDGRAPPRAAPATRPPA